MGFDASSVTEIIIQAIGLILPLLGILTACILFQFARACNKRTPMYSDAESTPNSDIDVQPHHPNDFTYPQPAQIRMTRFSSFYEPDYPPTYTPASRSHGFLRPGVSFKPNNGNSSKQEKYPDNEWKQKAPLEYESHLKGLKWQQEYPPSQDWYPSREQVDEIRRRGYGAWRMVSCVYDRSLENGYSMDLKDNLQLHELCGIPVDGGFRVITKCMGSKILDEFDVDVDGENTPLGILVKLRSNSNSPQLKPCNDIHANDFASVALSANGSEALTESKRKDGHPRKRNYALYVSELPLLCDRFNPTRLFHYFEVTILKVGRAGCEECRASSIAIGLTTIPYPPNRPVGMHKYSIGLYSDSGRIYQNDGRGVHPFDGTEFTSPFTNETAVTIGCGYDPSRGSIFYTKNGYLLGENIPIARNNSQHKWKPMIRQLHAAITCDGECELKVNFGQNDGECFLFAISNRPGPIVEVNGDYIEALPTY